MAAQAPVQGAPGPGAGTAQYSWHDGSHENSEKKRKVCLCAAFGKRLHFFLTLRAATRGVRLLSSFGNGDSVSEAFVWSKAAVICQFSFLLDR